MGEKLATYQPDSEEVLKLNIDEHDQRPDTSTAKDKSEKSNKQFLKYVSLVTLTIQNASLTLFMRAARTQNDLFITSTAVIMSELLKLLTCLLMVYREEGKLSLSQHRALFMLIGSLTSFPLQAQM